MANFYINLELYNQTNHQEEVMTFEHSLTYTQNFIPSDYVCNVMRFDLPNYGNPIFHFVDGDLKLSMVYKLQLVTEPVVWIPWSTLTTGRSVYYMSHFIYMLNSCLKTCWTSLNALITLPTTDVPYFKYNNTTGLISLVAHKSYYLTDDLTSPLADPIYIFENTLMNRMLEGMPVHSVHISDREFFFKILNLNDNIVDTNYLEMTQEASSFNQICDQTRILFYSDIPTIAEISGVSGTSNTQTAGLKVLADYIPSNFELSSFHTNLIYNAVTPYRTVQLTSQEPIRTIRINCSYVNNLGEVYQLYMPPKSYANIKLLFTPKNQSVNIKNWNEMMRNSTRL
jgi:hypothetical protein